MEPIIESKRLFSAITLLNGKDGLNMQPNTTISH